MKKEEAQILRYDIARLIETKGMPINVRDGGNLIVSNWFCTKVFDKAVQIDEPLGTVPGQEYEHCPVCNGIIGNSAFFCKKCGAYIREVKT